MDKTELESSIEELKGLIAEKTIKSTKCIGSKQRDLETEIVFLCGVLDALQRPLTNIFESAQTDLKNERIH